MACLPVKATECVVLLHGLVRSSDSMIQLEEALSNTGYQVENIDYPSRKHKIAELADLAVKQGSNQCNASTPDKIHFVTHSLGGILVRYYLKHHSIENIGRVVMLGPPNQGSEVVDKLRDAPGFELLNGPAGLQLGTQLSDIPRSLGPVDFELGIVAGTRSINLILSTLIPEEDDGKVSVTAAKVEGMQDFLTLPVTHTFMMKNQNVIEQVIHFLAHGKFKIKQ
ncbi:MAG: pimeloyl-ACP methyl ester carboxylesterase [Parasphingorhabdus sp.]|jgi:pimeloyl-ACP methyl ester carboxylesterase